MPRAGPRSCRPVAAVLDPDRFFDPDPAVRRVARELYEETRGLPIVSPHGHVDPGILARDEPFAEPAALIVQPDHYILRLLYARGVPLETLGVPRRDGAPVETDPCKVWQRFADHYYLFRGTPTGAWLDYELHEVFRVASPDWPAELEKLGREHGAPLVDYAEFLDALKDRRTFFKSMGATATDHAVLEPYTTWLSPNEADVLYQQARQGDVTPADERRFVGHLLMEMARLSLEDGLVMQIHAGALRDHNRPLFQQFGPDRGGDIPVATEFTRNLRALLNAYGNDPRFTLIVFTLDESTYSRELAPLAGHYPAMRLGSPWWFHDSLEGMRRFRERTTETAGIHKTAGFNDDTRAFCSIPARRDLARRVDADFLAGLVARHVIDTSDARRMARALAYELAKETYKL